ncbi:MAG: glycosyltransferase family 4 protein [Steroidobacteraceae bacterium]
MFERVTIRKILFIANQYHPNFVGGAEISVQTLVEEISRQGLECVVVSLSSTAEDSVDSVNGIRVYRVATRNLYTPFSGPKSPVAKALWHLKDISNARMARQVGRILDFEQPDWVSAHNLAGFSVAVWREVKFRGIGLSHMLHDYYLMCFKSTLFRRNRNCAQQCVSCKALSMWKRAASRQVDLAIGISGHVLQTHVDRGYFPRAHAVAIHNARAFERNDIAPLPHSTSGPLRIGYMGRLEQSKGVEVLLAAVSTLAQSDWTLRLAGRAVDPAYHADLVARYDRPQIEFCGHVAPAEFYQSIDVLVVPSNWHEPLGMVVVESLGFGIPVIGARSGGIPEILGEDGPGWLFEPGNVAQLSAILRRLLADRDSLEALRPKALKRRQHFLPARQAADFLRAIGTTLAEKDARAAGIVT